MNKDSDIPVSLRRSDDLDHSHCSIAYYTRPLGNPHVMAGAALRHAKNGNNLFYLSFLSYFGFYKSKEA